MISTRDVVGYFLWLGPGVPSIRCIYLVLVQAAFGFLDVVLDAAPRSFAAAAMLLGVTAEAGATDVAVVGLFGLGGACGAVFEVSSDCIWWWWVFWVGVLGGCGIGCVNVSEHSPQRETAAGVAHLTYR